MSRSNRNFITNEDILYKIFINTRFLFNKRFKNSINFRKFRVNFNINGRNELRLYHRICNLFNVHCRIKPIDIIEVLTFLFLINYKWMVTLKKKKKTKTVFF